MEVLMDLSEAEREEYEGKKATAALQRALAGAGAWMVTSVRDQRKCDHPLLSAEMPPGIRAKVAKILQERGVRAKEAVEPADPKAPWHQQLEQHVARLMQQMRSQPQQFRQLLLMAAADSNEDCGANRDSPRGFVDSRSAYRRLRRAAMALGEEIFYMVRAFVRRSETNGVLSQDAQVTRLASLYKLELRRHVTISAVIECIQQANNGVCAPSANIQVATKIGFPIIEKRTNKHHSLRRQVKSAGVTNSGLDSALTPRAASAPADSVCRGSQSLLAAESGLAPDKVKTIHAFKLQALERLLAKTWQGGRSSRMCLLQALPTSSAKLSDEALSQIQERVTAFLYHRSRENYPLWSEPPLSREETARHLRTLVATLMTTPLLQGLSIDQLLEVARAARWQMLSQGNTVCTRNMEIDALIVVMDGSLVSSASTDSISGPSSPVPTAGVVISSPACLGELGMVRNAERWPQTLVAQSEGGAKALILAKLTFEALLHRFFSGSKAIPPALAAAANVLQPRRPSSSPAVVARRIARSFRNSLSGLRPSTAAPTAVMQANIARWHEVRDEKLRDYRAGLEAEQRATALEALQKVIAELASASPEEDDPELMQHPFSRLSPRKSPWSRHENYPSFNPPLNVMGSPERNELQEEIVGLQQVHATSDELQSNNSPSAATGESTYSGSSTEVADQLREFYRTLNARRSVMKTRLASSVTSDQMAQQFSERRGSGTTATTTENTIENATEIDDIVSETTWCNGDPAAEDWSIPSGHDIDMLLDENVSSTGSPVHGRRRSASFSSQLRSRSAASSPSKASLAQLSPQKSPPTFAAGSPSRGFEQGNNTRDDDSREDKDPSKLSGKEDMGVPETNESDGEGSPMPVSKNQNENDRAATFTRARKSALNIMLTRQSTAIMARHSKLIDAETAQSVLIQKHFADASAVGGTSPRGSRPQFGRPQSAELHQSHSHAPLPLRADLQQRMDFVLNELRLPPRTKLDLVLKYTHADHYDQLPVVVQLWERVHGAVTWRERIMSSLWEFELLASDPRRHFRSISTHRLREEKERDTLFFQLNRASKSCIDAMDELFRCCGDVVCLGDRPYREKMQKDYIELLYEVEQERLRIIYDGIRPHVASAIDDEENQMTQEDGENLTGHYSSGKTLINVRVPSVVAMSSSLAPRRPHNRKNGSSPRLSGSFAANNTLKIKVNLSSSLPDNQDQEVAIGCEAPEISVDGTNAVPTSARYQLATLRESIYVPVSSLNTKQEPQSTFTEPENQIRRASRVTVQVQKHRLAELAALSKQLEIETIESTPPTQTIRPPEKTCIAPAKEAKKSASRVQQQDERASLRELFHQFMTRSNS